MPIVENDFKKISVIITAHDRRRYLYGAISSVINQTIDRSNYEIIVIKNFLDEEIDQLIKKEGILSIKTDDNSKIGEDIYLGINNSSSDIICFLDDDDLFKSNKLEIVLRTFSENPNLSLYINARSYVREDLSEINPDEYGYDYDREFTIGNHDSSKLLLLPIVVNMSSMCIKRKVLTDFLSSLKNINFSPDDFMLYATLCNQGNVYRDNKRLTLYRVHESSSQAKATENFEQFLINKRKILELHLRTYEYFESIFNGCKSQLVGDAITFFITDVKINLLLLSSNCEIKLEPDEIFQYYRLLIHSLIYLMKTHSSRKKILKFFLWYQTKFIIVILATFLKLRILKDYWNKREFEIKNGLY